MQQVTLELTLTGYIGNLRRDRHAVLIPQYPDGRFLIGEKKYLYPPGIYRLIGGGVEAGETPEEAIIREAAEELGITIDSSEIIPLVEIKTDATTPDNRYSFITYIFLYKLSPNAQITPADDLSGVKIMALEEIPELVTNYTNLKDDDIFKDGEYQHSWGDYGKIYGPIHRIVYELLKART